MARKLLSGAVVALLLLPLVGVCAAAVLAQRVEGVSMQPTLADGQRMLLRPGTAGRAARFDVVVLDEPGTEIPMVKRVIAVAGDRVRIAGHGVQVQPGGNGPWQQVVNPAWKGQFTAETWCCDDTGKAGTSTSPATVPEGSLFVMGDNPDASDDSRKFGWADIATVQGRVSWLVWPLGEAGGLPDEVSLSPRTG